MEVVPRLIVLSNAANNIGVFVFNFHTLCSRRVLLKLAATLGEGFIHFYSLFQRECNPETSLNLYKTNSKCAASYSLHKRKQISF